RRVPGHCASLLRRRSEAPRRRCVDRLGQDEDRLRDPVHPSLLRVRAASTSRGDRCGSRTRRRRDHGFAAEGGSVTSAIPIKRLASVTLGKMVQPDSKAESDIYAPYLRAAHVQPHGNVIELPDQRMWFSRPELLALDLRQGDVVVVEGGAGYGRSAVLREDLPGWGFQNSIVRLRPAVGVADGRYLDYALQDALADGRIDLVTSTATLPHFTADKVSKFEVPSPALDEQRAIADYLDHETAQIDALVAKQEEFIGLLRERRSAVILSVAGTISAKETRPLRRLAILSTGSTPSGGSGEDNFVGEREIGWVT